MHPLSWTELFFIVVKENLELALLIFFLTVAIQLQNQKFEPKESDASAETRQPKVDSGGEGPVGYTFTDLGIAEIERQLQQKKFSR